MSQAIEAKQRRYTRTFKTTALDRVKAGELISAVARDLGIHPATIHGWRHAENGTRKHPPRHRYKPSLRGPRRASDDEKIALLSDLDAGMPWVDICDKHNVVPSTIYRWAKQSGRYLFGELRTKTTLPGEDVRDDRWWSDLKGVDDDSAKRALDMLREGITRRRFVQRTGFTAWVADTFVVRASAILGTPKFIPRTAALGLAPKHSITAIDWSMLQES